jgi:hypothetical protein
MLNQVVAVAAGDDAIRRSFCWVLSCKISAAAATVIQQNWNLYHGWFCSCVSDYLSPCSFLCTFYPLFCANGSLLFRWVAYLLFASSQHVLSA